MQIEGIDADQCLSIEISASASGESLLSLCVAYGADTASRSHYFSHASRRESRNKRVDDRSAKAAANSLEAKYCGDKRR